MHYRSVQTIALPLTEFHHPATFQSRGVAMPFTTPLLAGARVRLGSKNAPELVIPNPSGGRGVYIVQWPGVRALCSPTVHDTMLFRRLIGLTRIDPCSIREAALAVALQGYAGTEATTAAARTIEADRRLGLRHHFQLLTALLQQVNPDGYSGPVAPERTPEFDRRASNVLHAIAPAFHCSAAHLATGLDALGEAFAPVGMMADGRPTRVRRLLGKLGGTRDSVALWLDAAPANDIGGLGRGIISSMAVAHRVGTALLTATQAALADPAGLLRHWVANPTDSIAKAARCDWLLDGWEGVCLLWHPTDCDASRRAALLEMAQMVPVLPREIGEWTDIPIPDPVMDPSARVVSQNDEWRRGAAAFALIRRNEALRAMSE